MSRPVSFDRIAPVYDTLSRLTFGGSIQRAQRHFVHIIPAGARVLIIGGGRGEILIDLLEKSVPNHITYVETSPAMIEYAKQKVAKYQLLNPDPGLPNIHFLRGTERDIPPDQKYDAVITNFVLDMYYGQSLSAMMAHIDCLLLPDASWLFTDFQYSEQALQKLWQKPLARLMYLFFHLTTGINIQPLPTYDKHFRNLGWSEQHHRAFFGRFIRSKVYRRIS